MKKKPKYSYVAVIQFKHGDLPREDVCEYWTDEERRNAHNDLREYRMSGDGKYRLIERRMPNE